MSNAAQMPPELPEDVQARLDRVGLLLATEPDLPTKLRAVVDLAVRTVTRCDGAGVFLVIDDRPTTAAVSSRTALEVDLVQVSAGEGPCLHAIELGRPVHLQVMEAGELFRHFAPGALAAGVLTTMSLPLVAEDAVVGALNLYSRSAHAFDQVTERSASALSAYAAELIAASPLYAASFDLVRDIAEGMDVRESISMAVGILQGTHGCSSNEAFGLLRNLALHEGSSMAAVAERICRRGDGWSP